MCLVREDSVCRVGGYACQLVTSPFRLFPQLLSLREGVRGKESGREVVDVCAQEKEWFVLACVSTDREYTNTNKKNEHTQTRRKKEHG